MSKLPYKDGARSPDRRDGRREDTRGQIAPDTGDDVDESGPESAGDPLDLDPEGQLKHHVA